MKTFLENRGDYAIWEWSTGKFEAYDIEGRPVHSSNDLEEVQYWCDVNSSERV